MKLFRLGLVLPLFVLGCASSHPTFDQKAPPTPIELQPPPTAPAPRKAFKGKDWEVTVEDDGWRKGTSDGAVLALMNMSARAVVILERKVHSGTLEEYLEAQESEFRKDLKIVKTEVVFAGHAGVKYEITTPRTKIWAWGTLAFGKGWFLTCGTSLALAEQNEEMCDDISKHTVFFDPKTKAGQKAPEQPSATPAPSPAPSGSAP